MEGYASGRTDEAFTDMILKLYEFSRSYPWPEKWLSACAGSYHVENTEQLNEAQWMLPLVQNIRFVLEDLVHVSEQALALTAAADGPDIYAKAIENDLEKYKQFAKLTKFTDLYEALSEMKYDRLASSRGFDGDPAKLELVKQLREKGKEAVKKICRQFFFC